jgi:hypothetical protein
VSVIDCVVFDIATGSPVRALQCEAQLLDAQAGEGQRALATSALTVEGNRGVIWNEAKAYREARLYAGAPTSFGLVQTDPVSRGNVMGLAMAAKFAIDRGDEDFLRTFTFYDDSEADLDAASLIDMAVETETYINACYNRGRVLRAAKDSAVDMVELLAIDVAAGWP